MAPVNPEGQTAQEVRRAALEEAAMFVEKHQHPMWTRYAVAQTIRALASTPSPAKQEQKIASAEGTASKLGAAPAPLDLLRIGGPGSLPPGPSLVEALGGALAPSAPTQPDARDAEIARLREELEAWKLAKGAGRMQAEITQLTKELEEARAALRRGRNYLDKQNCYPDVLAQIDRAIRPEKRAAPEPKAETPAETAGQKEGP